MDEKDFERIMNDAKNHLQDVGFEVTANSGASLGLELGKVVYTNDNFKDASLNEIMHAVISFTCSYINARDDFAMLTQEQRQIYITKFLHLFTDVFFTTEKISTEVTRRQLKKRVENSCNHKGYLIHDVLNEEFFLCTRCKSRIRKKGYKI